MADSFFSFSDYFNQLDPDQPAPSKSYDLSGDALAAPAPTTAGPAPSTTSTQPTLAASAFSAPTSGAAVPSGTESGAAAQISFSPYTAPAASSDFYSKLFAPVSSQVQQGSEKLGGAVSSFLEGAGPYRTFEGIGGQATLEGALSGANQQSAQEEAARLVGARYSGPTQLDQGATNYLAGIFPGLQARSASLTNAYGVEDLLKGATSGLTSGQRRLETQRLLSSEDYRAQAAAQQKAIQDLFGGYTRSQEEARGIAGTRQAQEADIAAKSRGFLETQAGQLTGDFESRISGARGRDAALQAAYDEFNKTGSLEALQALDAAAGTNYATTFNTGARQLYGRAEEARSRVLNDPKYAAIKDVPLLTLGATRKGREALFLPKEFQQKFKNKYTKRQFKEIQALARERQSDLEKSGFASGSFKKRKGGKGDFGHAQLGEFGRLANLYFQDPQDRYTPEDIRPAVNFELGTQANRANLATAGERSRYNIIQELLGSPDQLEAPEVAYDPSAIVSDPRSFLAQEEAKVGRLTEQAELGSLAWQKAVAKARRGYKSSRLARTFAKLGAPAPLASVGGALAGAARRGSPSAALKAGMSAPVVALQSAFNPLNREILLERPTPPTY